jgi:YVTN family beta-propeller protein
MTGRLWRGGVVAALAAAMCLVAAAPAAWSASVVSTITVGSAPDAISSDGTHVWVADAGDNSLSEIDASTGTVVNTISVAHPGRGVGLNAVSSDGAHVWVTNGLGGTVTEVSAADGSLVQTIPVPNTGNGLEGISSDGTDVWVTVGENGSGQGNAVTEIDASTGAIVNTIPLPVFGGASGVSSDGTHVWVGNYFASSVTEIDASTGTIVRTIPVGNIPSAVSSDGTHVWVTNFNDNTVSEIDAATGTVVNTIPVGNAPKSISSDGTDVWVTNQGDDTVSEIDASTGTVVATIPVLAGSGPDAVSSDGTDAWVANINVNTVSEIAIRQAQTITFGPLPNKTYGDGPFTVSASASSGLPVSFASDTPGACTVAGSTVTIAAVDTCTIDATQAGDATYLPATEVTQSFAISYGLAIDQSIISIGTGIVTTAPFSTTGPRLLVAFTSSDGAAARQTTTVTGAGLTWTLVQRANTKGGTAEIWTAEATGPLTNATVTSTPKTAGYDQSLTVVAFTGAAGIGASASDGKAKGAPAVSLTTTEPGSWVFGVGEDYSHAIARTLGPDQSLISQWVDPGPGETFWVQDQAATTPVAGTTVTMNDTAPTTDIWNLAAVEILPAASS